MCIINNSEKDGFKVLCIWTFGGFISVLGCLHTSNCNADIKENTTIKDFVNFVNLK